MAAKTAVVPALQRRLALGAAWLLLLSLLTGLIAGAALTGRAPADGRTALSAHVTGVTGVFLLLAVAWTLPMIAADERGLRRLAGLASLAAYSNWAITLGKAFLRVSGLEPAIRGPDGAVFVALHVFVVAPSLAFAVAWIAGLSRDKTGILPP